ncbi:hypothetical protein Nepgr_019068 [Nepenthes gracilis]|uniref:Uncharacterized protein n=1 Tax=Nepenthes gracilis TaxID=150966 RepID=A0AAD3SUA9_NEPGR|nr:hypothetical protein Nepgr_019068 [Nepenthes gracilis]
MRKLIGFQITEPASTQFIRHLFHRFHSPAGQSQRQRRRRPSRIINWNWQLKRTARSLSFNKYGSGHLPGEQNVQVPKGHMVVSVGAEDDDCHRILVPVLYCNHPLFAELLKEAEEKYGFDHPGGIRIPCQMSEFENVTAQIAAGRSFGDIARQCHLSQLDGSLDDDDHDLISLNSTALSTMMITTHHFLSKAMAVTHHILSKVTQRPLSRRRRRFIPVSPRQRRQRTRSPLSWRQRRRLQNRERLNL